MEETDYQILQELNPIDLTDLVDPMLDVEHILAIESILDYTDEDDLSPHERYRLRRLFSTDERFKDQIRELNDIEKSLVDVAGDYMPLGYGRRNY